MYSNNILNFQESTTILNANTKKVWKLIVCTSYMLISLLVDEILLPRYMSWFNVVSGTLVGGASLTPLQRCS